MLLDKAPDADQRLWYAQRALEHGWSGRVLAHQIESRLHERAGRAITNFAATLPPADSDLAQQATKDPYLFDFLAQTEQVAEADLERGLIEHVQQFLLELGQGFAFVGRQVHLQIGRQDFYADLLFYYYRLRAFVVIELKAAAFKPGHVGQLGMYMSAVDDLMAQADDKPTIGLLLCKTRDTVVAEYALRGYTQPMGVAEWTTTLTRSLPAELTAGLPSIADLEAELADPRPNTEGDPA